MTDRPSSLRVVRVEVLRGHLICIVELAPGIPHETSPALADRVLKGFPNLPQHACVNERGRTFGAVMAGTPLPHLLEHMIVDLQVREMAKEKAGAGRAKAAVPASDVPIVGTSEWLDEPAGRARIDVSFADDLVALRALRDAVAVLNDALTDAYRSKTRREAF